MYWHEYDIIYKSYDLSFEPVWEPSPLNMYWRGCDVTYRSYDLSFGAVRGSSDTMLPAASDLIEAELYADDALFPSLSTVIDIAHQVGTSDNLKPAISDIGSLSIHIDNTIRPTIIADRFIKLITDQNIYPVATASDPLIALKNVYETIQPFISDLVELETVLGVTISPSVIESNYIESDTSTSEILKPALSDFIEYSLYSDSIVYPRTEREIVFSWNEYDLSFRNYDLSFANIEARQIPKRITLFEEDSEYFNVLVDDRYIKSKKSANLNPSLTIDNFIESNVFTDVDLNPVLFKNILIESDTSTSAILYPIILDSLLTAYFYGDDTIIPSLDDLLLIEFSLSDTIYVGVITDVISAKPLQPTYLKFLSDSDWSEKTIYMKESDGSWSAKSIYMKQVDKSWM